MACHSSNVLINTSLGGIIVKAGHLNYTRLTLNGINGSETGHPTQVIIYIPTAMMSFLRQDLNYKNQTLRNLISCVIRPPTQVAIVKKKFC
jgi:hypothetical protein